MSRGNDSQFTQVIPMSEQRRHQRIRFSAPPSVRIGQSGCSGRGTLENLSLSGLMLRTDFALRTAETFGCEFSVRDSAAIDLTATVVSKIGDCYGARFEQGPIGEWLIQDAIDAALAAGKASILSINDHDGRTVMRVIGGLNGSLRNDFLHGLTRVGVADIDLSGVTEIDADGLELCRIAIERHGVTISRQSRCVASGLEGYIL